MASRFTDYPNPVSNYTAQALSNGVSKLREAKRRAVKEGWHRWIRNENDEAALLEGCWFDQAAADHVVDFFRLAAMVPWKMSRDSIESGHGKFRSW